MIGKSSIINVSTLDPAHHGIYLNETFKVRSILYEVRPVFVTDYVMFRLVTITQR